MAAGFVGSQLGQDRDLFVTVSICRQMNPAEGYALHLRRKSLTSQAAMPHMYADVCLQPQGTTTTVKAFLKDNFNYEYDRLYICVIVLFAYLAIFWCVIVWGPSAEQVFRCLYCCTQWLRLLPSSLHEDQEGCVNQQIDMFCAGCCPRQR